MKRWISGFLIIPLLMGGCASMQDKQKTQVQGTVLGAAIGATLGAIIGNQMGDSRKGAILGAMVGGMGGLAYGDHVANKKAQFAKQEDYLDACIAQTRKVHDETQQYNAALQQQIAALDTQSQQLMASYQQQQAARGDVVNMKRQLQDKLAEAQQNLKKVNGEIMIERQVLAQESKTPAGDRLGQLETQINQLEQQKAQLTEQTQRLAAINNRMSV